MRHHIEGTTIFDGDQAQKGYALNRMCFSFNSAENRAAFVEDEDAYCAKYGLTKEQRAAVKSQSTLSMLNIGQGAIIAVGLIGVMLLAGSGVAAGRMTVGDFVLVNTYLIQLAGILGLNVQDIGAQQTGLSVAEFKEKLVAAGR